ncbi:uncharacterized protein LOC121971008 isoform X1 [Zingiber officinale]|uniref:Uncharacterized protein n=1 Tax=Zingiber officinale TaxID=94328 RepID=A0A8J5HFW6_ZINOF|nr:uncharacterized protein LOC121971008 isoform X1 [Zingiber officinale]KAG6515465.1 hypothetical protein ZIOFF_025877 [Zingiber officinale]
MASTSDCVTPVASDRKRRALEALEKRFAFEAERRQESVKSKRIKESESVGGVEQRKEEKRNAKLAPSSEVDGGSERRTRGKASASSSSRKDVHPVYSEISGIVDANLLQLNDLKAPNARDTVSKIVNDIVAKGDEANKYTRHGKSLKIDNLIYLDQLISKDDSLKDARLKALMSHSKRSRNHMSNRQHRKCGSFNLPREFHKFDLFTPMHEMWKGYIVELMKEVGKKQLNECLLNADLHGAFLLVVECKTSAYKGESGIMIRETSETFGIITKENRFRVVPKVGSVFIFQADCWKITLLGDKLSKRSTNKLKP